MSGPWREWGSDHEPHVTLPSFPVIVVHLEDPKGSGLAACCGLAMPISSAHDPSVRHWLCTGCLNAGKARADSILGLTP